MARDHDRWEVRLRGGSRAAFRSRLGPDWLNLRLARQRAEREAIRQALAVSGWNLSRAAELLGITRPTLYDLLEKNDIAVPERTAGG